MKFKELKLGDRARLLAIDAVQPGYASKLLSLGLTPGVEFELRRVAPLGDPIEISLRGFQLSLRRAEAAELEVEKL